MTMKVIVFLCFQFCRMELKPEQVFWTDFQRLKDPFWFSRLSSKSNTFGACKVVQLSWIAESMFFIKSHSQPKPRESVSWLIPATQAEDFKAGLDRTGHKSAMPPWTVAGVLILGSKVSAFVTITQKGHRLWNTQGWCLVWHQVVGLPTRKEKETAFVGLGWTEEISFAALYALWQ